MLARQLFYRPRRRFVCVLVCIVCVWIVIACLGTQLPSSTSTGLPVDENRNLLKMLNDQINHMMTAQEKLRMKVELHDSLLSRVITYFHKLSAAAKGLKGDLGNSTALLESPAGVKNLLIQAGVYNLPAISLLTSSTDGSTTYQQSTDCSGPWPSSHPDCPGKMKWMNAHWKSDPCYASLGVDGSQCSFQRYLSEVENWCPRLPGREPPSILKEKGDATKSAAMQFDVSPLVKTLAEDNQLEWIQKRISRRWPKWEAAGAKLNSTLGTYHHRYHILLHMGLLGVAKWKIAEGAFHGGPLGELVQWSDLIAALYLLGHELEFSTSATTLKRKVAAVPSQSCPGNSDQFDLIYTDIAGLKQFRTAVGPSNMQRTLCRFRVVDSFGTEPSFNLKGYRPPGRSGEWGESWGNWNLHLRQFMTMFPHTPDNSFLGFVVEHNTVLGKPLPTKKEKIALVYGKELDMWSGQADYLKVISKHFEVHATIGDTKVNFVKRDEVVPSFVHDHGLLDATGIQDLLRKTWLFVGIGQPYEGPAALEAMANGCVFFNPQFNPPRNRINHRFFKSKPTLRQVTSQHPYQEIFVGEPYVYTIDTSNLQEVEKTVKRLSEKDPPLPYLPYEFTTEGFLVRLNAYLKHQDFCNEKREMWPPASKLKLLLGDENVDCKMVCQKSGLVCEPEFFPMLNTKEAFKTAGAECSSFHVLKELQAPSYEEKTKACVLQEEKLLLGCVGEKESHRRLCPCRSFVKGQVALCEGCK